MNLPTIEECQAFLAKINEGRALIDLEPLQYLDFDNAKPGRLHQCLSAINLFKHAGYKVLVDTVEPTGECRPEVLGILEKSEVHCRKATLPPESKMFVEEELKNGI